MKLKRLPGIRIVDIKTNEAVGVLDINGRVHIKMEYIKKRLTNAYMLEGKKV